MAMSISVFSEHIRRIVSGKAWTCCITILIIINTIILAMETYPDMMNAYGHILTLLDQTILYLFVLELILRFSAYRLDFFKNPWSIFDLCVIGIAFVPYQNAFSALRAARALRVLRLISIFPKLRKVVEGLVMAIPGICAIAALMAIIIFVFGLIASKLYGSSYPEWFGNLHLSIFSLFQVMTLEGWPDIVRTVMKEKPFAWAFFVTYILIATFSVLNLFIAVVVDSMQRNQREETDDNQKKLDILNEKLDLIIGKINKDRKIE